MIEKWFKLRRQDIAPVQFIVEGYEGMATVTTIDSRAAIIKISVMPDFVQEITRLMESLKKQYQLEEIKLAVKH